MLSVVWVFSKDEYGTHPAHKHLFNVNTEIIPWTSRKVYQNIVILLDIPTSSSTQKVCCVIIKIFSNTCCC